MPSTRQRLTENILISLVDYLINVNLGDKVIIYRQCVGMLMGTDRATVAGQSVPVLL